MLDPERDESTESTRDCRKTIAVRRAHTNLLAGIEERCENDEMVHVVNSMDHSERQRVTYIDRTGNLD